MVPLKIVPTISGLKLHGIKETSLIVSRSRPLSTKMQQGFELWRENQTKHFGPFGMEIVVEFAQSTLL
jgi:hypothetical protein